MQEEWEVGEYIQRYFHLPQSIQATNERIELLQTQLDNERRERQQKDELVKKLSTEMTEKDVTPMGAYEVDGTQLPIHSLLGKTNVHYDATPQMFATKVSIDSSLVDAACIPDVGNNGLKTVKDGVGGFFAWPKNQVVLDEEVTPTTIQNI
ncbi:hypothetical protein Tco_0647957 [Tanacetum coccineum]